MSVRVMRFSGRDWSHLALLLAAEGALMWLLVNLVLLPADPTGSGMSVATVAMLVASASVLPRLLLDRGIWGSSYSLLILVAVAVTTLVAVAWTSFPEYDVLDRQWFDEARSAVIRQPSEETIPVWLVIPLCGAIWWRGITRARPEIDHGLLLLKGGSAGLFVGAAGHALLDEGFADRHVSGAVLLFFVATLLAIAMMRLQLSPWQAPGRWLESVLVPVVFIVAPAALLTGLLTRDLSGMVELLLDPVVFVLTIVLRVVSLVLVVIAMAILLPLVWLFSLLPVSQPTEEGETPVQFVRSTVEASAERGAELPNLFRYVVALIILTAIFAGLARFRLRFGYQEAEEEPDHLTARIEGSLLNDLRGWLTGLLRTSSSSGLDPLASLRDDDRWVHTIAIRERYADFLRWSSDRGMPRQTGTTPDEHEIAWTERVGKARAEAIRQLTAFYDLARYGENPMTAADARAVEDAWRALTREPAENGQR